MIKAHLVFTKYPSSFNVHVENLEELSVEQIQQIEQFVNNRKGVFDFDTYSFAIQKRLEYNEFITLLEHSSIAFTCRENILKTEQKVKVAFGKYKGMYYSDIPDAYLLWLKGNYRGKDRDIVDAEISFRSL